MTTWTDLAEELRRWTVEGRRATLWWRDDDAGPVGPAIARLLALSRHCGVPLSLAVIPERTGTELVELLETEDCAVLQHGLSHHNHAPEEDKKAEFGAHRPVHEMLADVAIGFEALRLLFGDRHLPVFVPPWNRIANNLVPRLPSARIAALSAFKPRATARPAHGVLQVNCHVDPVAWHDGRKFVGTEAALTILVDHLRQRRRRSVDSDEATGILTHHQIHDEGMWSFLERLFEITRNHDSAHWLTGAQVFRLSR